MAAGVIAIGASGSPTWITAQSTTVVGKVEVALSGFTAQALVAPVALLAGAAALTSLLGGRAVRVLCAAIAALASAGLAIVTADTLADPAGAAAAALSEKTGVAIVDSASVTPWGYGALAVAALVAVACIVVAVLPAPARVTTRFDVTARGDMSANAPNQVSSAEKWAALDRGEDPTSE
ncbi:hypothetical protein GCM10010407_08090 [Rarobacter incanus]